MANPLHYHSLILHLLFLIPFLQQNHSQSQPQSLWTIQQLLTTFNLNNINENSTTAYCTGKLDLPPPDPNPSVTLVCYENNITQLHITGNPQDFHNEYYQQSFSTESFFSSLSATFPGLKVLSLVSLGLNGPLPGAVFVNGLSSLEILNISSNQFNGVIPFEISYLKNLQTLVLDHNSFYGQVPGWLGFSLPFLTVLSFKNNSFDGFLPDSLSQLLSLRVLDLSVNRLSGEIPDNFQNLTNLQVLNLENNEFGPHFPVLHNRLISLVLGKNRFQYGISLDRLRSFYQLQKLDISSNEFNGPFSPTLFSLPSLAYLDISRNKFTGKLSENISCSPELVFINLSSNRLTGDLPSCMHRLEKDHPQSVLYRGNCLANVTQKQQQNHSFCHNEALAVRIIPHSNHSQRPNRKVVVVSSVLGGVVVGGIALFSVVFLATRRDFFDAGCSSTPQIRLILEKISPAYTIKMLTDARYISETMKLGAIGIPAYRTYVLEELIEATDNFCTLNQLGNGSHGQLYKGQLSDGKMVAIRKIKMRKRCSIQSYTRHIELISKVRHPNLVSPIGHCFECYSDDPSVVRSILLVFEFVPNGMLRGALSAGKKFSWTMRLAAAIGIAKGIQFLHAGIAPGIFSNKLKITDVLLDQSFHAKISSYNLPLLAESKNLVGVGQSVTKSKLTLQRRFKIEDKDQDDVYDLGVILLELILGRIIDSANDITVAKDLLQVSLGADDIARRSIVDPLIHKECSDKPLKTLMELCVKCLSSDRPSIDDTLWNLQFIAQSQESSLMEDSTSNQGSPEARVVCTTD